MTSENICLPMCSAIGCQAPAFWEIPPDIMGYPITRLCLDCAVDFACYLGDSGQRLEVRALPMKEPA